MTDKELEDKLAFKIKSERKITNEILQLINLALDRKLYLKLAYPSMFEWLVRAFGYSESAAYRRIEAAKLLRSVPEVAGKLESGELNLSALTKASAVFRAQEKATKEKVSRAEKAKAVARIEGKTGAEAERLLLSIFPDAASMVKQDRVVVVNQNTSRISVNLSDEVMQDLARVRDLLSHTYPDANYEQIIGRIAKEYLDRKDPLRTSVAKKTRVTLLKTAEILSYAHRTS